MHINDLLKTAVASGASDLHLKVGSYPMMRVNGTLVVASEEKRLDRADTEAMAAPILGAGARREVQEAPGGRPRLQRRRPRPLPRATSFQQRGTVGIVLRVIPIGIKIDRRARPAAGPQADRAGGARPGPRHRHHRQRQEHDARGDDRPHQRDAPGAHHDDRGSDRVPAPRQPVDRQPARGRRSTRTSFAHALRSALRQDPDVILVGEMRDFETVETALHAAETGHLVFSTLHTLDATETINRIIAVFPPHQQRQVRIQLASVLRRSISQRLMPRADGLGRVAGGRGHDRHRRSSATASSTRTRRRMIHGAIAAGTSQYGMQTLRPVDLQPLPAGAGHARRGAALGVERRRVQAEGPGHRHHRRPGARRDGARAAASGGARRSSGSVTDRRSAYLDGLHLLARRELSVAECRARLARQGPSRRTNRRRDRAPARDRRARRRRVARAFARTALERQGPRPPAHRSASCRRRASPATIVADGARRGVRRHRRTSAGRASDPEEACAAGRTLDGPRRIARGSTST